MRHLLLSYLAARAFTIEAKLWRVCGIQTLARSAEWSAHDAWLAARDHAADMRWSAESDARKSLKSIERE